MCKFYGCKGAVTVDSIYLCTMLIDIGIIPDPVHRVACHIRIRGYLAHLYGNRTPAAFSFHGAQGYRPMGLVPAVAGRVGYCVKAVGCD